ncbi:MAG: PaaI family thioesterase [Xanthomonadales bacterium]|nr:PaaI family thioesterase [Xanthomonadales bacterium]
MNSVPSGFEPVSRTSPFAELIGPVYQKPDASLLILAIRAERKHCNVRGHVHGGVLGTLADIAMGHSTAFSTNPPTPLVTVNLSIDFAGKAELGDWIEIHTDVLKVGRNLAFANCHFQVGGARIARASAVFSIPAHQP